MINTKLATTTLGISAAILYVLCVLFGLFVWTGQHELVFEAVLAGFRWLTFGSFLLGLVEALFYGTLAGLVYSVVYNALARLWAREPVASTR